MYDYSPLWQTMKNMEVTTYRLIKDGIDRKTLFNLQHNKNVTVITLEKLCTILNCSVENVVRIVPEEKGEET
ncbi:MAG: helix-turn-helix transcriptional regulator [Clostridium sp.]|nr:helix-turn-helix transcriptional regulator [Clostridium sp.]